jgi:ATP-dependent DNA helicase DinG
MDGVSGAALAELADLMAAAGGRTLALFSSWRGVERAHEYLVGALEQRGLSEVLPMLVQQRGDAVGELVARFAAQPELSLLGTLSLWQGVDVPGHTCSLVVIDRIPFPRPDDPVTAARSRAADESGTSGFASISLPRAALLLAQGTGRLIRSADDRGVIAVLDSRLATKSYGAFLRASMPPYWWTTDGEQVRTSLSRLREDGVTLSAAP